MSPSDKASMEPVRAIARTYAAAVASRTGRSLHQLLQNDDPHLKWVEPRYADEADCVRVSDDDAATLRAIWPPCPNPLLADRWGPTATRTVAVATVGY